MQGSLTFVVNTPFLVVKTSFDGVLAIQDRLPSRSGIHFMAISQKICPVCPQKKEPYLSLVRLFYENTI